MHSLATPFTIPAKNAREEEVAPLSEKSLERQIRLLNLISTIHLMTSINWVIKPFAALTPDELYAMLRLRSEVFVVEQNCIFLDMDNKDQHCFHLMGWQDDLLAASTRLVPPGISYELPSIGRVVSSPLVSGTGIGRELMIKSIERGKITMGNLRYKNRRHNYTSNNSTAHWVLNKPVQPTWKTISNTLR